MKRSFAVLAISSLFTLSALASDFTYNCVQRTDRSSVDPMIGKISVSVTHVKQIARGVDYQGEYADSVDAVKVVVTAKRNGKTSVLRAVNAVSMSEDVMFQIRDNGISFNVYLDEMEEASIKFYLNGKKHFVSLDCREN